jgi:hypothetical protein
MIFISRKKFEREVSERAELELKKFYEMRDKEDRERELFRLMSSLQGRIEKIEEKIGIPTNLMCAR